MNSASFNAISAIGRKPYATFKNLLTRATRPGRSSYWVGTPEHWRGAILSRKDCRSNRNLLQAEERLHTKSYTVDVYIHLALAYQVSGELEEAVQKLEQAATLAQEIDRREILPHVYYHLGDLHQQQENLTAADVCGLKL